MSPHSKVGDIGFGVDPVRVATFQCCYLLNQWVNFDQTCIDTLLLGGGGRGGESIKFW